MEKKLEDLKQQIKSESIRLIEIQQKNPLVNFKNLENSINLNFENNKNWLKNLAKLLIEPRNFAQKGFNENFVGFDFAKNGMICSYKDGPGGIAFLKTL